MLLRSACLLKIALAFFLFIPQALATKQVDCQQLGFTGLQLCSDCAELRSFVADEELVGECLRCCAVESAKDVGKFSSAVLEICPHRLRSYPHIEGFIEKKASNWPNLQVRMKYGIAPRLVFKSKGQTPSIIRIDQWKTEHIEEYLIDRLVA